MIICGIGLYTEFLVKASNRVSWQNKNWHLKMVQEKGYPLSLYQNTWGE